MKSIRGSARPIVFLALALAVLGALGFMLFAGGGDDADAVEAANASERTESTANAPEVAPEGETERAEHASEATADEVTAEAAAAAAIPADATGIAGRIIGRDGKPAAGVTIVVSRTVGKKQLAKYGLTAEPGKDSARFQKEVKSNDDGLFVVTELIADAGYVLRARGEGGLLGSKDNLEAIEKLVFDIGDIALRRGAIVGGTVRAEGGVPLSDAEVRFDWYEVEKPYVTDAIGKFRSDVVMPGKRQIRVKAKGYALREQIDREFVEGDVIDDLDIEMVKAEPIRGRVVDDAGRGIPMAWVNCYREQDGMSFFGWVGDSLQTGPNGDFLFDSLPAGKYQVSCNLMGYRGSSQEGVVAGGDPVELKLTKVSSIEGRVFDHATNEPVKADSVRLMFIPPNAKNNTTFRPYWRGVESDLDEPGRYKLSLNEGGQFKVIVNAEGYRPGESQSFQLSENSQLTGIDVRLVKGQEAEIVVLDKSTKAPVQGAVVRVNESASSGGGQGGGRVSFEAPMMLDHAGIVNWGGGGGRSNAVGRSVTDATGTARVKSMYPGKFTASVKCNGYAPAVLDSFEIKDGAASTRIEIEMSVGGRIEGTVKNERNVPEPALTVFATSEKGEQFESVTDDMGRYVVDHLAPRRYRMTARIDGDEQSWMYESGIGFAGGDDGNEQTIEQKFPLVVAEGLATRHDFSITRVPPGSLVGSVLMNGTPAPNVMVMVMKLSEQNGNYDWNTQVQSKTDAQGRFKFRTLKPGKYGVITGANWERTYAAGTLTVTPGQEATAVLDIPLGSIRGRVVDGKGAPVSGVDVYVERQAGENEFNPWGGGRSVTTDARGEFVVDELHTGDYTLSLNRQEYKPVTKPGIAVHARRETGPIELTLVIGGWIKLEVTGMERVPANSRLRAQLTNEAGEVVMNSTFSSATPGTYWLSVDDQAKGTLRLFVRPPGQPQVELTTVPYALPADGNLVLPITLP